MRKKEYVYVLREEGTDFYRIGSTHSIEYREGVLRQGNPRTLNVRGWVWFHKDEIVLSVERFIQKSFKHYRYGKHGNSWYLIKDENIVKEIIELICKIQDDYIERLSLTIDTYNPEGTR
jgi:hypothetical protein